MISTYINDFSWKKKKKKKTPNSPYKPSGVSHKLWPLPFTLENRLRQKKKHYENSKIFHHSKNIIFKKNPLKETKILQDIIITL